VARVRPLALLVAANPVTPFVRLYQELLFFGRVPGPGLWLQAVGLALVAWAIGSWIFERLSQTLVEAV
jgi:ABC-type polysaccharide/polyol phosphate export permease